jgi:hypothetical protein
MRLFPAETRPESFNEEDSMKGRTKMTLFGKSPDHIRNRHLNQTKPPHFLNQFFLASLRHGTTSTTGNLPKTDFASFFGLRRESRATGITSRSSDVRTSRDFFKLRDGHGMISSEDKTAVDGAPDMTVRPYEGCKSSSRSHT